jgi:hypothetical protein
MSDTYPGMTFTVHIFSIAQILLLICSFYFTAERVNFVHNMKYINLSSLLLLPGR